jgi:RNA polymerase sigma factor (TIGR02999 family)
LSFAPIRRRAEDRVKGAAPQGVTDLLQAWSRGDREAGEKVVPLVYDELRRQAARYLRRERREHTLRPTALVHEAYLRMMGQRDVVWPDRAHFFAMAAKLMRHILVDHARRHHAAKRAGSAWRVSLDEGETLAASRQPDLDLVALEEALDALAALDPDQARIVELRFFGGLGVEETAEVVGVSPATVKREWRTAKAWLRRRVRQGGAAAGG